MRTCREYTRDYEVCNILDTYENKNRLVSQPTNQSLSISLMSSSGTGGGLFSKTGMI